MKETIKSTKGYKVKGSLGTVNICEGNQLLFCTSLLSKHNMITEVKQNKCLRFCELFKTIKNNWFIYYNDCETDKDFVCNLGKDYFAKKNYKKIMNAFEGEIK